MPTEIQEAGARHSASDIRLLQTIHDHATALGAGCGMDESASASQPSPTILTESASWIESPDLVESVTADYAIKLISPGRGSSGYYSPEVLRKAAESNVFRAGTQMFWNHDTDSEESSRPEGDLNRLAAVTVTDAKWEDAGRDGPGLYARAKVFSDYADKVREKGPHIGLSIRASGDRNESANGPDGKPRVVTALKNAASVDFVTKAGRGGKVFTEAASESGETMNEDQIKAVVAAAIKEALAPVEAENKRLRETVSRQQAPAMIREALRDIRLPDPSKNKIIKRLAETELPADSKALGELIEAEARSEAQFLQEIGYHNVAGFGQRMTEAQVREATTEHSKAHEEQWKQCQEALADMFVGQKLRSGTDDQKTLRESARETFMSGRAA